MWKSFRLYLLVFYILESNLTERNAHTTAEAVLKSSPLHKPRTESIKTSRALMNTRQFENTAKRLRRRLGEAMVSICCASYGETRARLLHGIAEEWKWDLEAWAKRETWTRRWWGWSDIEGGGVLGPSDCATSAANYHCRLHAFSILSVRLCFSCSAKKWWRV